MEHTLSDDEGPPAKQARLDTDADEESSPPANRIQQAEEWSGYSSTAFQIMKNMGFQDNKGLGKQNQGRLEPIEAVQTDGRRGLGSKQPSTGAPAEMSTESDQWIEVLKLPEEFKWLKDTQSEVYYTLDEMSQWLHLTPTKLDLDDETHFCKAEILAQVLASKNVFDNIDDFDLRRARSRSNPFETIRSSIFLNRAAVKMANIDSMCDFMFTKPCDKNGQSLLAHNELLYFADICAGPGGFSEYVLFRKAWEAKGFGLTLKGSNDFKLDKFTAGSPESFDPYYGVKNDGDVFDQSNQDSFRDYIFKHTSEGVHFVMADGGFSVEGQNNIQEVLSKQLYLCQCLTALKILRTNGSFVCKLFDLFTPFSVGLVYLMYKCFEKISIIKPNSSRPANSERYIVCKWKRPNTDDVCEYMNKINAILNERNENQDVREIVPMEMIKEDDAFFTYITESNNIIGENQIFGLRKIAAYHQNPALKETRQSEVRTRCLQLWHLPDKLRQAPEAKQTEKLLAEILGDWKDFPQKFNTAVELTAVKQLQAIESVHDWYFMPIGRGETSLNTCSIFLCKTKGHLLRNMGNRRWEPVDQIFEISPKTLFYGEIVYEYCGQGRTQTRVCSLHIMDAITLGGIDIRKKKLSERVRMCQKYANSLNKPYKDNNIIPAIRSKTIFHLQELDTFFKGMHYYALKENGSRLGFELDGQKFFVPGGIVLMSEISFTFFSKMSKQHRRLYYYNKVNNSSHYADEMSPDLLYSSFRQSFNRKLIWKWTNIRQVEEHSVPDGRDENVLYRDQLQEFIQEKLMS